MTGLAHGGNTAAALRWSVYPVAQLRTPGFGWTATVPRPTGASAEAERRLVRAEAAVADAQAAFVARVFPAVRDRFPELDRAARNAAVRCGRRVRRALLIADGHAALLGDLGHAGWVSVWSAAVVDRDAAADGLAHALAEESAHVLDQVRERVREPRVARALSQSTPGFAARLHRDGGVLHQPDRLRGKDFADLATAHRFLRRIGTRCETVSFFGPSLFVRFDDAEAEPLRAGAPAAERVDVDAAAWLVRDLAERARRGLPADRLPVSRDPLWRTDGDRLVRDLDGRTVPLNPAQVGLWRLLDGWRTTGELAQASGSPVAEVRRELAGIRSALRMGVTVPATERHGLAWLVDALARLAPAGAAVTAPARLREHLDRVARTDWPERAEVLDRAGRELRGEGLATSRGEGAQYADRAFWHEECASPYSERTVAGRPTVDGIGRVLAATVPLLYLIAVLERADARLAVRRALGGQAVNLAVAAGRPVPAATPRADALRAALAVLATERARAGRVSLSSSEVDQLCAPYWATLTADERYPAHALPGVDLLATGTPGEGATWVVGEVHDDSTSILGGSSSRVHSDAATLYDAFCRTLSANLPVASLASVVSRRRSMHITPEPPGLSIELTGVSAKPPAQVVPISAVAVAPDGAAVTVDGTRYHLYPGDLRSPLHRAVSLPCLTGLDLPTPPGDGFVATPRVLVDGVVVHRAAWSGRVDADPGTPLAWWRRVQRLRREHRLPDRVFVRHEREPKPVFVDLDDPVAVRDLARFGAGRIRVSECLPDVDQLWWRPHGAAQAAELRLACLISPDRDLP
ncbi:hypothetical protein [Actinoplanes siamensis]|uniref:Lantibiotic dehydratase n=1 Tax=Actinoplanes siamensis TaxID=1223317 RepID=A0A919TKC0_9ACTN|nr:hypothetical protein [Actinoplanes siamensis]GIF05437.1 lantibiotic dehydratase [Actinoplanes siamensis]